MALGAKGMQLAALASLGSGAAGPGCLGTLCMLRHLSTPAVGCDRLELGRRATYLAMHPSGD